MSRSPSTQTVVGGLATVMVIGMCTLGQAWPDANADRTVTPKEPLALTYVANSGVLAASGEVKVLIDALFDRPNPEYRAPAPDVLDKVVKGTAPFDGVDVALVTHNHPDHFDARVAVRFMETSGDAVLLAPADAVAEMRSVATDWARIGPRVLSIDVKIGERLTRDVRQVAVTAIRTQHSGNRDLPANLMYLLEFGGWRVFHEGDSPGNTEEYQRLGLGKLLLARLIMEARALGHHSIVARIADHSPASIALHRSLGFEMAGELRQAGFKSGRWIDVVLMQLVL